MNFILSPIPGEITKYKRYVDSTNGSYNTFLVKIMKYLFQKIMNTG